MIVANSYDENQLLGSDDSRLDSIKFRATWILMIVSGIFCTVGKEDFVNREYVIYHIQYSVLLVVYSIYNINTVLRI